MKKRVVVSTSVIFIILTLIAAFYVSSIIGQDGFDIQVKNSTNESIIGLKITYHKITKDIEIPEIEAGNIYKINVKPQEDFAENQMLIYYKDKRGVTQKNTLVGYFEKGYDGKIKVDIKSVDENGLIIMQVQEKIY